MPPGKIPAGQTIRLSHQIRTRIADDEVILPQGMELVLSEEVDLDLTGPECLVRAKLLNRDPRRNPHVWIPVSAIRW